MSKPLISSAPLGNRISTTLQMEDYYSKKIVIKGEVKYPHTSWLVGMCKKQAKLDRMEIFDHHAILLHETLLYKALQFRIASSYSIKSTITPLEVRTRENNYIMISSQEKQVVQATSKHERHLIRELTQI
jgi:hypothetical protein